MTELNGIKLSKEAVQKLYEDYSRNYIVQTFLLDSLKKKLEKKLAWFGENGYEDADHPATNETFKEKAKEKFPDEEDEEELKKHAEALKTEYTDVFTDIPGIRHQIDELNDEILNSSTVLPILLELLNK